MKHPMIADAIAKINTAPAAMSLIIPALALYSGETRSTSFSKDELNNSALITIAKQITNIIHSVVDTSSLTPVMITTTTATR